MEIPSQQHTISWLRKSVIAAAFLLNGKASNNQIVKSLCRFFKAKIIFKGLITIREVWYYMPNPGWTKVNVDGAALGQPGESACGWIFRIYRGFPKGSFAMPLGVQNSIFARIKGFIIAVEIVENKGWFPLWIGTDSFVLVSKVTSNIMNVPWRFRVRWRHCLNTLANQNIIISHL